MTISKLLRPSSVAKIKELASMLNAKDNPAHSTALPSAKVLPRAEHYPSRDAPSSENIAPRDLAAFAPSFQLPSSSAAFCERVHAESSGVIAQQLARQQSTSCLREFTWRCKMLEALAARSPAEGAADKSADFPAWQLPPVDTVLKQSPTGVVLPPISWP